MSWDPNRPGGVVRKSDPLGPLCLNPPQLHRGVVLRSTSALPRRRSTLPDQLPNEVDGTMGADRTRSGIEVLGSRLDVFAICKRCFGRIGGNVFGYGRFCGAARPKSSRPSCGIEGKFWGFVDRGSQNCRIEITDRPHPLLKIHFLRLGSVSARSSALSLS